MHKYVRVRVTVQPEDLRAAQLALGRGQGQRTTDSSHSGNRESATVCRYVGKTPPPLEPSKWDDCIYEKKDAYIYIKSGKNVCYL